MVDSFVSSLVFSRAGSARTKSLTVEQALGGTPRGPGRLTKRDQSAFNKVKAEAAAKQAQQEAKIQQHNQDYFKSFRKSPTKSGARDDTASAGNTERAAAAAPVSDASQTHQLTSPTNASRVSSSHGSTVPSSRTVLILYWFVVVWTLVVM